MKIATWNVNGLRACLAKLEEYVLFSEPDIIAVQETKLHTEIPIDDLLSLGYFADWNFAERAGYSGTLCLFKNQTINITHGEIDNEGRIICLEYADFYFVNVYVPNSQGGRDRWYFRLDWNTLFEEYIQCLTAEKPVIIGDDFNVARDFIDIYPENLKNIEHPYGFLTEERDGLNSLLELGLTDVFRELYPQKTAYSWWSNKDNNRLENRGRRIDYFLISEKLLLKVKSCNIRTDVFGSDHAPIELEIDL